MENTNISLWNIMDKFPQSDINCITHNNGAGDTVMGVEYVHKAMKEACRQTLELVVNKSEREWCSDGYTTGMWKDVVDKQSILNTINQIK